MPFCKILVSDSLLQKNSYQ